MKEHKSTKSNVSMRINHICLVVARARSSTFTNLFRRDVKVWLVNFGNLKLNVSFPAGVFPVLLSQDHEKSLVHTACSSVWLEKIWMCTRSSGIHIKSLPIRKNVGWCAFIHVRARQLITTCTKDSSSESARWNKPSGCTRGVFFRQDDWVLL